MILHLNTYNRNPTLVTLDTHPMCRFIVELYIHFFYLFLFMLYVDINVCLYRGLESEPIAMKRLKNASKYGYHILKHLMNLFAMNLFAMFMSI